MVGRLFVMNLQEGGLFEWWDRKVLFPLRQRNSKLAKPLGECELCASTWLGGVAGTIFYAAAVIWHGDYWWLLAAPSVLYLAIGLTGFFYLLTSKSQR